MHCFCQYSKFALSFLVLCCFASVTIQSESQSKDSCEKECKRISENTSINFQGKLAEFNKLKTMCSKDCVYYKSFVNMLWTYGHLDEAKNLLISDVAQDCHNTLKPYWYNIKIAQGDFSGLSKNTEYNVVKNSELSPMVYRLKGYDSLSKGDLESARKHFYKSLSVFRVLSRTPKANITEDDITAQRFASFQEAIDVFYQQGDYARVVGIYYFLTASHHDNLLRFVLRFPYTACNIIDSLIKIGDVGSLCSAKRIFEAQKALDDEIEKFPLYYKVKKLYSETLAKPENALIVQPGYCNSIKPY